MDLQNPHRYVLFVLLLWLLSTVLSTINAQPLLYYKSEKIIVGETWMKNISTVQEPRILKSTQIGNASFNKAGKGYLLQYDNQGIAEYDTIVFTADGEIHAYALKNQFLQAREDYFISEPGQTVLLDVLANDDTYTDIELSGIPFEEGVKATIQEGKVRLESDSPGLYHFYYTACDGSGHCDEAKVTVFVMDPSYFHDTIVLSEVIDQQLTLPLPDAGYELTQSTIEHVYPDGEGFFDVDLFRRDLGENEILFQNSDRSTLLYKLNFIDKWGDNKLNTKDKVYVHPGKLVETSLTDNDLWVNIYSILSTSSDIQVTSTGSGRVRIQPKPGFSGKASFQYVTCAYPRCDTTRVNVYVDHFKPAKDQFDIFVDPSVAYHIPFYTPSEDYQLTIEKQPTKGSLELTEQNHSLIYTPGSDFSGEDKAKIKYTYQNGDGNFESFHYIRFLPSPHPFRGKCKDCVWPGDTDENGVVNMADIGPIARYIGEQGPVRSEGTIWKGQWNYPWMNFEHEKLNHFDADGNGLISYEDLQVIIDYFGKAHGLYTSPVTWLDIPIVVVQSEESVSPGNELVFEFQVGDEDHELYNVNGFSTDVKIEGQNLTPADVEVVRDEKNWLKSHQPTMTLKSSGSGNGQVAASEFRVRSIGVKGYGTALKLRIIVEDEVEGFRTLRARSKAVKFIFRNLKIHTGNGVIHLPDQTIEIPLKPADKSEDKQIEKPQVFPNPAREQISVRLPATEDYRSLEILDLTGKRYEIQEVGPEVQDVNMVVKDLSPGMYILRCKSGEKVWNQKLTIIR